MQLDMFGASDELSVRDAVPPVVSVDGAWVSPEVLAFNAALHRGSLGDAVNILNRLKTDTALRVLLASGFTVGASNNRVALIAGVQMDILAAARLRKTGAELWAARKVEPEMAVQAVIAPVVVALQGDVDTVRFYKNGTTAPSSNGVYELRNGKFSRYEDGRWMRTFDTINDAQETTDLDGMFSPQYRTQPEQRWSVLQEVVQVLTDEKADVEPVKNDIATLRGLKELSVMAEDKFKVFYASTEGMHPDNIEADKYFTLSGAKADADAVLAKSLASMPDDGFALHGKTGDGRDVMLCASAQRNGYWQLTRFDAKGEPWGDTQYETKALAVKEFLQDIDTRTLDSVDGLFGGEQVVRTPDAPKHTLEMVEEAAGSVPTSIAVVQPGEKTSRVIQDAGEELTYNRRNRVKSAKGWGDIANLNDALKVKEAVKANIWPKPDYKQLIADGMPPMVAHIVKQIYDSVAVKPMVGRGVLDDAALQKYIVALNRIEGGVMAWAHDAEALQQWSAQNARFAGAMLGRVTSLRDLTGKGSKTLLDMVYPDGYKPNLSEVWVAGGNKMLGSLQPGYNDIKKAIKAIDGGWPEKREAWEVQGFRVVAGAMAGFEQLKGHANYILHIDDRYVKSFESEAEAQTAVDGIKPFVLFGKRGFVDSFDSEEDAIASAKERSQKQKTQSVGEKGARVDAIEREGVSRRMEGEDISSERLVAEFGLKGVNFGNWMKTPAARVEAQLHLNHAFDSFHDLAEILGVPPKAMSLNGMLGLAIGAQGSGGSYAAHFVPGVNEINLTRTSGAGSLAHEIGHAIDHYFAVQAGLATATEPFLTEHADLGPTKTVFKMVDGRQVGEKAARFGELRPEVVAAFKAIVESMDKRLQTEEEAKAGQASYESSAKDSVGRWLKSIRRDFGGLEAEFDVLAAKVQAGDVGDGKVALGRDACMSPVVAEIRDLYKSKHGRTYSIDNIKALQSWVDSVAYRASKTTAEVDHVPQKVASDFAKNARALDREKGGKPYWSTKLEKFARAFDAFVSDELEAKQAKNGYLSHTGAVGDRVPMGSERLTVNAAFRSLVGEIKVRETEQGVALFSSSSAEVAHAMPMVEIDTEIARLRGQWPSIPKVTVVQAVSDLPFEAPWNADGAYSDGQVYVVAGNVADLKQLQKVMAHECVMHHALDEMLGDYGFSKLHHGIQKLKKGGDPVVVALAENIRSRYGELPPEIETKEIVARAGEQCLDDKGNVKVAFGFMKSVFAGVAGWLRDHGINVPFSNVELQGVMHSAGQWVARDVGLQQDPGQKPAQGADGLDLVGGFGGGKVVLHSFAGVRAETAPLDALRLAREMLVSGVDDRVIWAETGWMFGFPDHKPRFEISDDAARFNAPGVANNFANNVLPHDALYAAYPTFKDDIQILRDDSLGGGNARLQSGYVLLGPDAGKSAGLHEIQHAIQHHEGFSRGGSAGEFKELDVTDKELSRINQDVFKLYEGNPDFYRDSVKATQLQIAVTDKYGSTNGDVSDPLLQEWWSAIDRREAHPESVEWFSLKSMECRLAKERVKISPCDQYTRLAGEVESRLVQTRMDMTPTERAAVYPVDQMDVPVGEQTVSFRNQSRRVVVDGVHSGKVIDVMGNAVTQKTGRGVDETVQHSMRLLSEKVAIGDVVEIKYRDGLGQVGGLAVGVDKGL